MVGSIRKSDEPQWGLYENRGYAKGKAVVKHDRWAHPNLDFESSPREFLPQRGAFITSTHQDYVHHSSRKQTLSIRNSSYMESENHTLCRCL